MGSNQFVARKRGPPIAFAARDKYDLALFVGEQLERALDGEIGAPLAFPSARVRKNVGPPFIAGRLSRMPPGPALDCITGLHHGGHQPRYIGEGRIEQDEIRGHSIHPLL